MLTFVGAHADETRQEPQVTKDNVIPFPGGSAVPVPVPMPVEADDVAAALARALGGEPGSPDALLAAMLDILGSTDEGASMFEAWGLKAPVLFARKKKRCCFVVRVDLDGAKPPIWRRLRLASDITLADLHDILQTAMGWSDSHLHHFLMLSGKNGRSTAPFLTPYDIEEGEEGLGEEDVRLDQVLATKGSRLLYEYDFGDGWEHTIRVEKVEPWLDGDPVAVCVDGRRACPPEDIGGLGGYEEVVELLTNGITDDDEDGWQAERLEWLPEGFDPAAFSVEEVNEALSADPVSSFEEWNPVVLQLFLRAGGDWMSDVGALIEQVTDDPYEPTDEVLGPMLQRYVVLLRTVGAGIKLTAAGYLPPRIVHALFIELGMRPEWIGLANREDQTLPVLRLRESATALGLLRKQRGILSVTKAGQRFVDDPRALWNHIRSRLPLGRPEERDAGLLALLYTATGRDFYEARQDAATILHGLGWRVEGVELSDVVSDWARPTLDVLRSLVGSLTGAGSAARIAQSLLLRPND